MAVTQSDRTVEITTPLGADVLVLRSMSGTERLGRLFEYELELLGENHDIALGDLLGQNVSIRLAGLHEEGERWFNGFVTRFTYLGSHGRYALYRASLRPWLWFLTRSADCRIFQEMNVPDIVKQVFRDRGFTDFDERLSGSYAAWEYCVQYRETDFNFVCRLLEQEGIYFHFRHEEGRHTLVLADAYSAHEPAAGYGEVPYYPPDPSARRERDNVSRWSLSGQVQPGAYALNDYDFEVPTKNLRAARSNPGDGAHADYEIYDYPGEYTESGDGDHYVRTRIEELHAQHQWRRGEGDALGLACGALFTLANFPREDQNIEYLLVGTALTLQSDAFESSSTAAGGAGVTGASIAFTATDAQVPFRPPRLTPKPVVQGPQTAVVVGQSGEEIWTDEYGRVKVQFHWDRQGERDENSSCWVRVAQVWAGDNWGAMHIPRIGQEVIVSFLEGDPDQPIVTGRVYNGDNMPPYALPENQTQSGIRSRSTKGGNVDNCNEIRFEDKMGEEDLLIHAEKNQTIEVENDESHWVGNDRTKNVDNDETTEIGNNRTETVGSDETITIGNNRTESVGVNEDITIGANRTESVGANEDITIGANRNTTVGANDTTTIGANRTENVGASMTQNVGASLTQTVGASWTMTAGGPVLINAPAGLTIVSPGGNRTIDNIFDKIGGTLSQKFGTQSTVCASSYNATGVAIGQTAEKIETTGQAFCATATNMETKGINMSYVGLTCDKVSFEIETVDAKVIA
ncbi:MAG: type VI secretion system tip protein TssI/VgrG [Gammaproteobacteria bacterium]|nr:type VI secretion system tip protein TssI/VgrG [Gammaproteobacteria bacterium]